MLRVHCNHFLRRIDRDSSCRIKDIVKNAHIFERFAHLIVARKRGPREPLALAAQAALRDSLQELPIEEAEPRHHCIISGVADNILDRQAQGSDQSRYSAVVSRLDMYHTNVFMYHTMVLLARPTKVRC